jgi:uncharacterized protein (DUF488 family)
VLIYTIGHSTRAIDEFIALLTEHGIQQLADVRTIPKSRRHPQFSKEALSVSLPAAGIAYRHVAALGGLRKPRADSTNTAWRHEGFRGYADYMESSAFEQAVDDLLVWADAAPTAVMCAEAVWWQCHRRLLADALLARGRAVRHIMTPDAAPPHELTEFARIEGARVRYPGLF